MDSLTPAQRSRQMGLVKGKNTTPEMTVRKTLWRMGYRYRLHCHDVPGRPDIVFKGRFKVIFVHGCFWHRHRRCARTRTPKSRVSFWIKKFKGNVLRDRTVRRRLASAGWSVLVIWECESEKPLRLMAKLKRFLGDRS